MEHHRVIGGKSRDSSGSKGRECEEKVQGYFEQK
jgi:hypothetical protein